MSINKTTNEALLLPSYTITAKEDLELILLKGTEGFGETLLTKLTYQQCADFFEIEDNKIPERDKLQREADAPRVKGIYNYLMKRDDSIFPSACLIITELNQELLLSGGVDVIKGVLPKNADRLFIDGQGRISAIKLLLKSKPELASRHLDVKVIVCNTKTIKDSEEKVKQIFSDFHLLKKPNSSQNIYFDGATSSSRFVKELLTITDKLGVSFNEAIAVNGKIKHGQLYNLANMKDFIGIMAGEKSTSRLNTLLDDDNNFNMYLALISDFIVGMYNEFPLKVIQKTDSKTDWKIALDSCVLTCAIGLKALAYVGRSLIEDALENDLSEINVSSLSAINKMPIHERDNKLWLDNDIYQIIEGKLTIARASEKRLARLMCNKARIITCEGLI